VLSISERNVIGKCSSIRCNFMRLKCTFTELYIYMPGVARLTELRMIFRRSLRTADTGFGWRKCSSGTCFPRSRFLIFYAFSNKGLAISRCFPYSCTNSSEEPHAARDPQFDRSRYIYVSPLTIYTEFKPV
jgi:hypothetical protein